MILRAYKYRIYPTKEQEVLLAKTFGCVRYVFNKALNIKTSIYETEKKGISVFDITNQMVEWKEQEETKWLKEVNSQALQMSLRNLDMAFTKFFREKKGYPKFKNKYDKQSFTNPQSTKLDLEKSLVFIPKFKKGIEIVCHRKFDGKIKSSTVSKTPTGKYFISILVEEDIDLPELPVKDENKCIGVDLGLKDFATLSDGSKISNPKYLKKNLKKLARAQRKLSRKKKGSKNREKQKKKVALIHEKITNCRKDFLHKTTSNLAKNQSYTSIAIEDLDIKEMIKNKKLSRSISDIGWGYFKQFLTYKCTWYSKNLITIGRFEPSSRLCECGHYNHSLTLKDRVWTCPSCNKTHDRDVLAANNIKKFAFREQNTYKEFLPLERRDIKPVEKNISFSMKQEATAL